MRTELRQMPAVLRTGGRLLLGNWPMLLALAFLGVALRNAATWVAVEVSDWNSFVGQLFLVLTPIGYLMPIIAMLHLMRPSLPTLAMVASQPGPEAPTEQRERRLVDVAVSFLVPFLAVYVSYGLMEEDRLRFVNEAMYDEFNQFSISAPDAYDFEGRYGGWPLQILVLAVLAAWVVRWALGRFERRLQFLGVAFLGALVEVYYTGQAARQWETLQGGARSWVMDRRVVDWVEGWYLRAVDLLGPLSGVWDIVIGWLMVLLGSFDAVVVVPMAWLVVAAVVLGHKITLTEEPSEDDTAVEGGRGWRGVVVSLGASFFADLRERWSALGAGVRPLASAGVAPMLFFGLVFLVALKVPLLLSLLVRWLVGPVETDAWLAFAPWEGALGLALSMALVAPMLAAAVEWVVSRRLEVDPVSDPGGGSRIPGGRNRSAGS